MAVLLRIIPCGRTPSQRWSVVILILLYVSLFLVTWPLAVPLRSLSPHSERERGQQGGLLPGTAVKQGLVADTLMSQQESDPKRLLESIFIKADVDGNHLLSLQELTEWINTKIQEHINQALQENFGLFTAIDVNPRNGMISWDEYHSYFLQQKGMSKAYAEKHDKKHRNLERSMREAIMRDRASWSEAARSDPDHLTLDEFLAFRHPESSHATILLLVEELFDKFDRDGDEQLTEDEFSSLPLEAETEQDSETLKQGEKERRKEFREVIDQDGNGKADRKELLMYIDPKNPRHAREEAETLLVLSDINHDKQLSLHEILNKMDLFLGSKMVDTARSFHDEF